MESNPGPGSNGSETSAANQFMPQTYGRGRGHEQNASGVGRGNKGPGRRNRYDGYERRNFDGNDGSARRITRSQSERLGQSAITSWFGIPRPQPPGQINYFANDQLNRNTASGNRNDQGDESDTSTESQSELTPDIVGDRDRGREGDRGVVRGDSINESRDGLQNSGDVKELLLDISSEMRYMNRKFDNLESSMNSLKQDNKCLKKQNKNLTQQVEKLSADLQTVTELAKENEKKNEKIESQSRRDNLNFFGFDGERNETWEESENKIKTYISEGLSIDDSEIHIERAHRLAGSKSVPKPIIVKFSFFKDKERVLRAYRQKKKAMRENRARQDQTENPEQGDTVQDRIEDDGYSHIRVAEDFIERVTNDRTSLFPFMQDCLAELVIDDVIHVYDSDKKIPVALYPEK